MMGLHPKQLASYTYTPPGVSIPPPKRILELSYKRMVSRREDVPNWRGALLGRLRESLAVSSLFSQSDCPKFQVMTTKKTEEFQQTKISFPAFYGDTVIAYLLIPNVSSEKRPGLVVIPGHGVGARGAIGEIRDYQRGIAKILVKAGYVVVVPELITYGERSILTGDVTDDHVRYGNYSLQLGRPLIALQLAEVLQSKCILQGLPETNKDKIGVVGISMGGRLAFLAAAIDLDVKVAVVASGLGSSLEVEKGYGDPHDEIPALLTYADYTDLAALVAPRPMLLQYGEKERGPYWYEARNKISYNSIRVVYEMLGKQSNLVLDIHEAGHTYNLPKVIEFLKSYL